MLGAQKELRRRADVSSAEGMIKFFKTLPGQYGYGDKFLGGTSTLDLTLLAKKYISYSFTEIGILLKSPYHEERAVGIKILVLQYEALKNQAEREIIVNFYLQNRAGLNNWDLVDMSAYKILGHFCAHYHQDFLILNLSESSTHWDKRIAMVSTLAYIRMNKLSLTYKLAKKYLNESEDLMHKCCGWMLREAGKRDSLRLLKFIKQHGKQMPRTMLRYALEKYSLKIRQEILKTTK